MSVSYAEMSPLSALAKIDAYLANVALPMTARISPQPYAYWPSTSAANLLIALANVSTDPAIA